MIETGIDLTRHKITGIGGDVACGKSFIMGLFIDELTSIGKNVCYVNIEGSLLRFDVSNTNVRCYVHFEHEDIIQFYEQLNSTGEEFYVCLDSIGGINFNYKNSNPSLTISQQLRAFVMKLKTFENIKTIFNFNYHRGINNGQKSYRDNHIFCCDKVIDVTKVQVESYKYDIYLDEKFLCSLDDLALDPKIRARERKISKLVD